LIRRNELRLLGYVSDALIPSLYAGAAAFCYPSRYEGFGLPALEAMASGVPVITSNQTSLPEVVGDAGLMFDPDDVDSLREELQRLLEDRVFADLLGQRGLARSRILQLGAMRQRDLCGVRKGDAATRWHMMKDIPPLWLARLGIGLVACLLTVFGRVATPRFCSQS
jgi:hypothetical protein